MKNGILQFLVCVCVCVCVCVKEREGIALWIKQCFCNYKGYIALNGRMSVNEELERLLQEVVMAYFKVHFQHLHTWTIQS